MRHIAIIVVAALAGAGAAAADTAYIEPSDFAPEVGQTITIEAAFNDYCCEPKYAVRSDAYAVILPDGSQIEPDRIETFATSTVIEQEITAQGTTRFSTGERLGRKGGEYVLLNGTYHLINSDDAEPIEVPEGARILTSQTATLSDSYVTIGEPTWTSVNHLIGRLNMAPVQHPSTLEIGKTFELKLSFDGESLINQEVLLTRSGQQGRAAIKERTFISDAEGLVSLQLCSSGTHVIMTRLQAVAPKGAETDIRSYTTALTFNVARR